MSEFQNRLTARINDRSAVVGIIGLGYVGLPLAMEFCEAGFTVTGYDVSQRVVDLLARGESHIQDVAAEQVSRHVRAGKFVPTTDESALSGCDAISIAVPTPLAKTRDPDLSFVLASADAIGRRIKAGALVVLESTTYPGTTRELLLPALEKRGLTPGEDVFVAFSPERVDPGNPTWHTKNTPKVVGGLTPACSEVAGVLYRSCIDTVVPVSSPEAAELVKLLENTFRSINIGLANEMAIVCDRLGVDVWEVIEAAATKPFGFMKFTPGPGIGGHCIPLDPHYLAWKMRTLNYRTRFIDVASEINSEMPEFVVRKVSRALNEERKAVNGSHILVLGVAYKRDIDDVRESPALDIITLLAERGAEVQYHDPHVPTFREDGHERHSVPLTADTLRETDAVVVITDHSGVDYAMVAQEAGLIVDSRNVFGGVAPGRARIVPLAGGLHNPQTGAHAFTA
jgi:UDP-N-acetyl-D-glucosamine dehydrogenase